MSGEKCRVCGEQLPKKSRRLIFNQYFSVFEQLCEVLGDVPCASDGGSTYVCSGCFNKLNKLCKIEFEIKNKVTELTNQKLNLLGELRRKYLESSAQTVTPKKSTKRIIQHTPTPRKIKIRPSTSTRPFGETDVTETSTESHDVSQMKSRKKLVLAETSKGPDKKEFTPGKVKVSF